MNARVIGPFDCEMCKKSPNLALRSGCKTNARMPVWTDHESGEMHFRCPLLFIPKSVSRYFQIENYNKSCNVPGIQWGEQLVSYTRYRMFYENELIKAQNHKSFIDSLKGKR